MQPFFVEADGHRIAVLAGNQQRAGFPIVLLHGFAASIHCWLPSLPAFIRDEHPWYSISLPGHYPSDMPPDFPASAITQGMFVRVLQDVIRCLVGDRPVGIVGWSTGGFAALNLAATTPDRVAGVLSISGFSHGRWHGPLGCLQRLANRGPLGRRLSQFAFQVITFNPILFRVAVGATVNDPLADQGSAAFAATLRRIYNDTARHQRTVLADMCWRIGSFNIDHLLDRIRVPVVIAGGDRVRFSDGTEEPIDVVVYATGYNESFPFFASGAIQPTNNEVPLYKCVVHCDHPNLFFLELLQPWGPSCRKRKRGHRPGRLIRLPQHRWRKLLQLATQR